MVRQAGPKSILECKLLILNRITALPRFAGPFQNLSNHFKIEIAERSVQRASTRIGITDHPDAMAMEQMARNATLEELGSLHPCRYLLHDRDTKFCESFREVLKAGGVKPMKLPARARSPEFERIRGEMGAIDKRGML